MGSINSSIEIPTETIYTEETIVIFKSEDQLSSFEKNILLNFNSLLTEKFTNIYNYFCYDYLLFENNKTSDFVLKEAFGGKFIEFINFSGFFKAKVENLNPSEKRIPNNPAVFQGNLNNNGNLNYINAECSYDLHKLRLLIFLTTKETFVTNSGFNYSDRVS